MRDDLNPDCRIVPSDYAIVHAQDDCSCFISSMFISTSSSESESECSRKIKQQS